MPAVYPYTQYSGIWNLSSQANAKAAGTWPTQPAPYLYAWGYNASGQLGLNNVTTYSSPKQIGTDAAWKSISAGVDSNAYIKSNGTLWAWGINNYGQLGLGNTTAYSSPVQVGALTTWSSVFMTQYHGVALKTDGTLWTWGQNRFGELGLGASGAGTYKSSPNQVGALTTWLRISGGAYFTVALKTDGTLWSWGYNAQGQLGLGNITNYSSPKQIGALTTWSKLNDSAGQNAFFAIKTDNTLWSWGYNGAGQLGLNNATYAFSSPQQVGALTNWSKVNFYSSVFSIKTDGTLWAWGYNNYGALGLGDALNRSSPTQIGALTNWSNTAAGGGYNGLAIKTDGTLWSWGRNNQGQLGLGNATDYSLPKQVGSLTTWSTVYGGTNYAFAVAII